MLKSSLSFSWNYPKITILVLLLITVFFGLGIKKLETRNSFSGELPADDRVQIHIGKINQAFGERSVLLIGIEAEEVFTEAIASKVISISEALVNVPFVMQDEVLSLSTIQNVSNIFKGMNTKATSEALFISSNTVKFHLKNLFEKIEAHNRVELIVKLKSIIGK